LHDAVDIDGNKLDRSSGSGSLGDAGPVLVGPWVITGRVLVGPWVITNPLVVGPCVMAGPVLVGPWVMTGPVLMGRWVMTSRVLVGPWVMAGPVLVGPWVMTSDLTPRRTSYWPDLKPWRIVDDREAGVHSEDFQTLSPSITST